MDNQILELLLENEASDAINSTIVIADQVVQDVNHDLEEVIATTSDGVNITNENITVRNFFETIDLFSEDEFYDHFRMTRCTMQRLIAHLQAHVNQNAGSMVCFKKKVYVTIWTLANKDSYREVGNLFGMDKSSVCHCFHEVCKLLTERRFDFIQWPSQEEQAQTKQYVFTKHGMPNCVGFVDGCHIQIMCPFNNPTDYFNRKETNSIVLQGICDESMKFIDIHLGHTGRAHDARIFRESRISEELHLMIQDEDHILGDSAYTLSKHLLTPHRDTGHLDESQRKYNITHSAARAFIERAFGRLKGKFRRLKYLEIHRTESLTDVVCAACVLHNFIILNEPEVDYDIQLLDAGINLGGLNGSQKRNTIGDFLLN